MGSLVTLHYIGSLRRFWAEGEQEKRGRKEEGERGNAATSYWKNGELLPS